MRLKRPYRNIKIGCPNEKVGIEKSKLLPPL